jgi:hypothetical protein
MPNTTTRVIDELDYFSTSMDIGLAEPIPGEEFDIVVVLPRARDRVERRFTRCFKRHQAGKARYKK